MKNEASTPYEQEYLDSLSMDEKEESESMALRRIHFIYTGKFISKTSSECVNEWNEND